jgi:hypothetical protein
MDTPIPKELDFIVKKSLKESESKMPNRSNFPKLFRVLAASTAACLVITVTGINSSQVFAKTMWKLPVIGSIVKVLTFREYTVTQNNFNANLKVPAIQGLKNKNLQNSLNEKYLAENKKLYKKFMTDMQELRKKGAGNEGVSSGYKVKTDNTSILSIERYYLTVAGSSQTEIEYDTIDKKNQILITLPSLFKNDSYVDIISQNILKQMKENMKKDPGKIYWIGSYPAQDHIKPFKKILENQNFYINNEGKLVICFNQFDVAPGVMGPVEFVIPTNILSHILVSNEYIK